MVEQRSPKPRAEGSSPSAPAKKEKAPSGAFFFFTGKTPYPRHARAGHHRRSAAGGGCSEVLLAQRSKSFAAPRRKRFRAPQEGEQSSANIFVLITNHFSLTTEYRGVAQLVARLLWEQDAGCSSHLTPTKKKRLLSGAAKGVFLRCKATWKG